METLAQRKPSPGDLEHPPLVLNLDPALHLTEDQFFELCQINRDLRIERNAFGELVIMPPAGGEAGKRNAEITIQLGVWAKRDGEGMTFDSSTGFRLPNGAVRSPDAAWVRRARWEGLTPEEKRKFIPLCPDFAIELRSPTDRAVEEKIREYMDNGAQLGWIIDPEERRVHVYRPQAPVRVMEAPEVVSGDPVLVGFALDMREVW